MSSKGKNVASKILESLKDMLSARQDELIINADTGLVSPSCSGEQSALLCDAADIISECFSDSWSSDFLSDTDPGIKGSLYADDVYKKICDSVMAEYEECMRLSFNLIDRLSCMAYEGGRMRGKLVFIPTAVDPAEIDDYVTVSFAGRDRLALRQKNLRQVRKMFAGADKGGMLLSWDDENMEYQCYGYLKPDFPLHFFPYSIEITGVRVWTLYREAKPLFNVEHGELKVWRNTADDVFEALKDEFDGVVTFPSDEGEIKDAIASISRQSHGTSVLFVDAGNMTGLSGIELNRLTALNRAIPLSGEHKLSQLDSGTLTQLGRIDGALVVDVSSWSVSHIATIVDGKAIIPGALDRGARYNSLVTYVSNLKAADANMTAVAAVFSEDGGVDIIRASKIPIGAPASGGV